MRFRVEPEALGDAGSGGELDDVHFPAVECLVGQRQSADFVFLEIEEAEIQELCLSLGQFFFITEERDRVRFAGCAPAGFSVAGFRGARGAEIQFAVKAIRRFREESECAGIARAGLLRGSLPFGGADALEGFLSALGTNRLADDFVGGLSEARGCCDEAAEKDDDRN